MLKVLIGDAAFAKGMDLYFERFDGTAATIENFISCFADAAQRDLTQFSRWYNQSGTPLVSVAASYDPAARTFTLDLSQSSKPTPGQPTKEPFVIPLELGLVAGEHGDLKLRTGEEDGASGVELGRGVIELTTPRRRIIFRDVPVRPVPSLFRGFSAPVRVDYDWSESDLVTLVAHDSDSFNRWQAAQTFATRLLLRSVEAIRTGGAPVCEPTFIDALGVVTKTSADPAFTAQVLTLPGEADIAREIGHDVDPGAIHAARKALRAAIGQDLNQTLLAAYTRLEDKGPYSPDAAAAGRRALRNVALDLLTAGNPAEGARLALNQFASANTMTGEIAALGALSQTAGAERETALDAFYRNHAGDALVIDKWFALQAMIAEPGTLARVKKLTAHPAFSLANPNRVRSLIGAFATGNQTQFNAPDGAGYDFIAETVLELDRKNPQVAARLLAAFKSWRSLETVRRGLAESALRRVAGISSLSPDVKDIAERSLA
jgi:aminopeptidase N